ncbi:MAG TPA: hypothetical protein PLV65_05010 [Tenuifilaceae bacterium]|nr:hypothetical protein [Tenuifilaceae bacterium]
MKKPFALILFALINFAAFSTQKNDTIPAVHFQIVDATNGKPISLGHIVNTGLMKGVAADMLGFFKMPIRKGDTLIITALGYHQMRIPSWGQFSSDSLYYPIRLVPRSYQIREIRITRFGSYQRFIREVTAMELPKTDQEILQEKLEKYFREQISRLDLKSLPSAQGGFSFGEDWISKQKALIQEKVEEELRWEIMLNKFSADIVEELTGLKGIEAIQFMEYCNFTEAFILLASDYEVRKKIVDKFEEYKKEKLAPNESSNKK